MKRITKYTALFLAGSLAALTACGPRMNEVGVQHTPVVNGAKIAPMADEEGTVRAYIGTEVSAEGFNLDRVSRVSLGDADAPITEQTIKTLKFKVPALELAQQDAPHAVQLNVYEDQTVIFTRPYYITVPVTDALILEYAPAEGTVGDEITLSGRNLEQITRVHFGGVTVEAADFVEATADALKFRVPAGSYAAGDSEAAISAEWGTNTIDVTGDAPFTLHTPRFDAVSQAEGENAAIGDEKTFTGANLDLVSALKWGGDELILLEQSAGAVTVKYPSSIAKTEPVIATAALAALWGSPDQTTVIASAWRVDTTPIGPAAPVVTGMTAEDGGADNKFYLGKTVTVTGENLASVEGFTVDGVTAALAGTPTDVEAKFIVPDGVTFTEAKEVAVTALYNGGNEADFGTATVYPFYCYKNVEIGSGSSSVKSYPYPEYAWTNAFFLPDAGRVISTDEWYNDDIDPFAKQSPNPAISGNVLNKANITQEQYYGVEPYLFLSTGSDGKLAWQSPGNSASQLKTHRYENGKTSVSTTYGTPIILFKVQKSGSSVAEAVSGGMLTSMNIYDGVAGTSAPAFGTGRDWVAGDVIVVQYVSYTKGAKPSAFGDVCRQGFIHITEVTCGDPDAGTATDLTGHVKFDFYWSKTLNE